MTFRAENLPNAFEFGAVGGPDFKMKKTETGTGRIKRNEKWNQPLWAWTIAPGISPLGTDFRTVWDFYIAMHAGLDTWLLRDKVDFAVVNQVLIASTNGETSQQLFFSFTRGAAQLNKIITHPVAALTTIKENGSPIAWTVNETTGVASGAALGVGNILTCDMTWNFPVYFVENKIGWRLDSHNRRVIAAMKLREERQPVTVL